MSLSLDEVLAALPKRLQKVFEDSSVTELMINSPSSVWFEKEGCLYPVYTEKTPKAEALTERMLDTTVKRIARPLGFDADAKSPIVDARLPDGSRVAIACPPITESFALSIRRFGSRPWTAAKLVSTGSIPSHVLTLISKALSDRENVLISGGTGTGKTTMLSAFASLINEEERIVCIEDTRELHIPAPNCLRLEAKSSTEDDDGSVVTIRNLVRHALRHRPDRLIVGEVRGEEAQDLIEALNTGHGGSISTVHANSARAALTRLATCALQSKSAPPWDVICEHVALAVQYVIHLHRSLDGRRGVHQVLKVNSYDRNQQDYDCSLVWEAPPSSSNGNGAGTANHTIQQSLDPLASTRLCVQCSVELPANGKGSQSDLCRACRRKQQNHAAYLRRKANKEQQTASSKPSGKAAPRERAKPRSRVRKS